MATAAVAINDLLATILYLDGEWSLDEFELFFRSFNDLYKLIAAFKLREGTVSQFIHVPVPFHRNRLNRVAREQDIHALRVLQIKYSSPGHIDLLGIGKVAEVVKDTVFGIADRIISTDDRELDRDKKFMENANLRARTTRKIANANLKLAHDAELHELAVEEKRIANERSAVALDTEKLEAAAKGLEVFKEMLDLARESGASDEDISKMRTGFLAKVGPIIPLILGGKLLAQPRSEERKSLTTLYTRKAMRMARLGSGSGMFGQLIERFSPIRDPSRQKSGEIVIGTKERRDTSHLFA